MYLNVCNFLHVLPDLCFWTISSMMYFQKNMCLWYITPTPLASLRPQVWGFTQNSKNRQLILGLGIGTWAKHEQKMLLPAQ